MFPENEALTCSLDNLEIVDSQLNDIDLDRIVFYSVNHYSQKPEALY